MSTTCARGTKAAPKTPCRRRAATICASEFDIPHNAEATRETGDRGHENIFLAEAIAQPSGDRRRDGRGDDVGGQYPRDLVLRGGEGALHVRQGHIRDRAVEGLHDRRQHDG